MDTIVLKTESLNMSEEDFFHFCQENSELRMERDRHQNIFIMSPSGYQTSIINLQIAVQLSLWNNKTKKGVVFDSNGGFTLPNGAVRSPDAAWIIRDRHNKLSKYEQERFAHICPDFVIELKSPSDSLAQQKDKMDEWMENGCRLGWLIDPENRKVHIYSENGKNSIVDFDSEITGDDVLEGFKLDLSFIEAL